jgi:hypothetical protein
LWSLERLSPLITLKGAGGIIGIDDEVMLLPPPFRPDLGCQLRGLLALRAFCRQRPMPFQSIESISPRAPLAEHEEVLAG